MGTCLGYPASRRWGSRRPGDILNSIVVCCMRSGGLQSRVLGHRSPVVCVVRAGTVLSRKRSTGSSPTASMAPALSSIPPSFTISSPRVPVAGRPASVCDGETFRPRFGPQGGSMLFGSPPDGWVARVPPPPGARPVDRSPPRGPGPGQLRVASAAAAGAGGAGGLLGGRARHPRGPHLRPGAPLAAPHA